MRTVLLRRAAATTADRPEDGVMNKIIALVVVAVFATGFLGFTTPGHRVLNALGFATACASSDC